MNKDELKNAVKTFCRAQTEIINKHISSTGIKIISREILDGDCGHKNIINSWSPPVRYCKECGEYYK